MWRYNNVTFIYNNDVDSIHGNRATIPYITTYMKSKFALMEALRLHVDESYLGPFTEIEPRSVKSDKPIQF
jgi:hypothetical protein